MTQNRQAAAGAAAAAVLTVALFAAPGPWSVATRFEGLGLAAAVAACVQLRIDIVGAPPTSVGTSVAIASVALLAPSDAGPVIVLALALAFPLSVLRVGPVVARDTSAWLAGASGAALVVVAAARPLVVGAGVHGQAGELIRVVAAGAGFFAVDVGVRRWRAPRHDGERLAPRLPLALTGVHLAMLCAAALLALSASELGPAGALVAVAPLLVIHFSFARYALARRTYDQAVRALSVIPEVAGLAELGHGERTAVYAAALTRVLGLDPADASVVVTAARIHHIGQVLDEEAGPGTRPAAPGVAAAEMLGEFGFLEGVAELVAAVENTGMASADTASGIVRVASSFDELVGDDPDRAESAAVELLARYPAGIEGTIAVALVRLCGARRGLVRDAVRQGRYLPASGGTLLSDLPPDDHSARHNGRKIRT